MIKRILFIGTVISFFLLSLACPWPDLNASAPLEKPADNPAVNATKFVERQTAQNANLFTIREANDSTPRPGNMTIKLSNDYIEINCTVDIPANHPYEGLQSYLAAYVKNGEKKFVLNASSERMEGQKCYSDVGITQKEFDYIYFVPKQ